MSKKIELVPLLVVSLVAGAIVGIGAEVADGAEIRPAVPTKSSVGWKLTAPPMYVRPAPSYPNSVGNSPSPAPTRTYTPPTPPAPVSVGTRAELKRASRCGR